MRSQLLLLPLALLWGPAGAAAAALSLRSPYVGDVKKSLMTHIPLYDAAGNLLGGLPEDEELEIASEFDRTWEADGAMEPWQYGSSVVL